MAWRRVGQRLERRMKELVSSQDAVGKIFLALADILPDPSYRSSVTAVDYAEGVVTIHTASKPLAAFLLMNTGPLGASLRSGGVRTTRIVVR